MTGFYNAVVRPFDFFNEMNRFSNQFDAFFRELEQGGRVSRGLGWPRATVKESEAGYILLMPLPGVAKEDLEITVRDRELSLVANRKVEVPEGFEVRRRERRGAALNQRFALPPEVDQAKVSAELKDGLLKVELPRTEAVKPRQISVN